ncbi:MAG: HEAT repeat domain-containing protein [Sphingomonadales bacterium]
MNESGNRQAPLLQALAHADWRTREQAADALREIGDRTAAPGLALLLSDPCWRVRFAAINALSRLGAEPGIFVALRHDTDRRVRALASRILNDQVGHRQ